MEKIFVEGAIFSALLNGEVKGRGYTNAAGQIMFERLPDGKYDVVNDDTKVTFTADVKGGLAKVEVDLSNKILATPTEEVNKIPDGYGILLGDIGKGETKKFIGPVGNGGIRVYNMHKVAPKKGETVVCNLPEDVDIANVMPSQGRALTQETIDSVVMDDFTEKGNWHNSDKRMVIEGFLTTSAHQGTLLFSRKDQQEEIYETEIIPSLLGGELGVAPREMVLTAHCGQDRQNQSYIDDPYNSYQGLVSIVDGNKIRAKLYSTGAIDNAEFFHTIWGDIFEGDFRVKFPNIRVNFTGDTKGSDWVTTFIGFNFGRATANRWINYWENFDNSPLWGWIDNWSGCGNNWCLEWNGNKSNKYPVCSYVDKLTPRVDAILSRLNGQVQIEIQICKDDGTVEKVYTSPKVYVPGHLMPGVTLAMANKAEWRDKNHFAYCGVPEGYTLPSKKVVVLQDNKAYVWNQDSENLTCIDDKWLDNKTKAVTIEQKGTVLPLAHHNGKNFKIVTTRPAYRIERYNWLIGVDALAFQNKLYSCVHEYIKSLQMAFTKPYANDNWYVVKFVVTTDGVTYKTLENDLWMALPIEDVKHPTANDYAQVSARGIPLAAFNAISASTWQKLHQDILENIAIGVYVKHLVDNNNQYAKVYLTKCLSNEAKSVSWSNLVDGTHYTTAVDVAQDSLSFTFNSDFNAVSINVPICDDAIIRKLHPVLDSGGVYINMSYYSGDIVDSGTCTLIEVISKEKYTIPVIDGVAKKLTGMQLGSYELGWQDKDNSAKYSQLVEIKHNIRTPVEWNGIPNNLGTMRITVTDANDKLCDAEVIVYTPSNDKIYLPVVGGLAIVSKLKPGKYPKVEVEGTDGYLYVFDTPIDVVANKVVDVKTKLVKRTGTLKLACTDPAGKSNFDKITISIRLQHKTLFAVKYDTVLDKDGKLALTAVDGDYDLDIICDKKVMEHTSVTVKSNQDNPYQYPHIMSCTVNFKATQETDPDDEYWLVQKMTGGTIVHKIKCENKAIQHMPRQLVIEGGKYPAWSYDQPSINTLFLLWNETKKAEIRIVSPVAYRYINDVFNFT